MNHSNHEWILKHAGSRCKEAGTGVTWSSLSVIVIQNHLQGEQMSAPNDVPVRRVNCWAISQHDRELWPAGGAREKGVSSPNSIGVHPLEIRYVCTKFHGDQSDGSGNISVLTGTVMVWLKRNNRLHKSQWWFSIRRLLLFGRVSAGKAAGVNNKINSWLNSM